MKRILALIMVLAMVFAFAACKSKDDGVTTTDPSSAGGEVIDNGDGSTPVDASAADSTDASNDASEVSTDASGKPVEAPSQAAGSQGGAQGGAQTGNTEKGLNSTDAKAVVAFYNKAVNATVKNPPKGKQTMKLEKLEGTGGLGKILGSFEGIAKKALEKNSTETNYIPAATTVTLTIKPTSRTLRRPTTVSIPLFTSTSILRLTARRRALRRVLSAARSVLSATSRTLLISFPALA